MEKSLTSEKHLKDKKLLAKQMYEEHKSRIPIKNMVYKDDPPAFVTIVGSEKSGKSCLIRALVKKFTRQKLDNIIGPVTITTAKDKRVTLFECKPDIHQFVDTSKISDLVIFVLDARVGLEMEVFEYLSLLLSHGLPKIMFVVTHVDENNDKKMFKKMKKRIYSEICEGLKFFYLGFNKELNYTEDEFLSLCRAISGMKYRPITWKCLHPHIVVDKIDENAVYGYVRGVGMKKEVNVHVVGLGDTKITDMTVIDDPVSIKNEGKLSIKKNILYAPLSLGEDIQVDDNETPFVENEEIKFDEISEIKLFKNSVKIRVEDGDMSEDKLEEIDPSRKESFEAVEEDVSTNEDSLDFEQLKLKTKERFRKDVETEEEYIKKFSEKYQEHKINVFDNISLQDKVKIEEQKQLDQLHNVSEIVYPGQYVKIILEKPLDLNVDFTKIIVLGTYLISENRNEIIQGKIKKNKWYAKLLKTNEPLLFSVGWKRFQSIPVFSMKNTDRNRMLKYSFQHGFCNINFYGPTVAPGTGFSVYSENSEFRIIGYGNVMDVTGNHNLVKKLKLIGYPKKIIGNTVFVKSMFNSNLEVLKFNNARLKTVSGLKGTIKNPIGKNGEYRASFEGNMLMGDIITLRCYVDFPVYKHLIPVYNLYNKWTGLRTLKEIREDYDIKVEDKHAEEVSEESADSDIENEDFKLPEEIESRLPLNKRNVHIINKKVNIPLSPEEDIVCNEKNRILEKRKIKNQFGENKRNELEKKKKKEHFEYLKDKELKTKKSILKNKKNNKSKKR